MADPTTANGAQVPCISLLAELSSELDRWLSGARTIPDTVHNRAVRNAVSVIADAVAITRARLEARQSDAERMRATGTWCRCGHVTPEGQTKCANCGHIFV